MRTFDFAMKMIVNLVVGAAILSTVVACGNTTKDRALSGAGIGAAGGAAAGAVTGTSILGGAVLGGVIGAAAGGLTDEDDFNLGDPIWK